MMPNGSSTMWSEVNPLMMHILVMVQIWVQPTMYLIRFMTDRPVEESMVQIVRVR